MLHKAYQDLHDLIKATYLIVDDGIIKLLCAAVVAHRLPSQPVWLFLVAGSSAGKSELLNCFNSVANIHQIDSLTTQTFISGARKGQGAEPSLLLRIQNGILTIKDFTTLLSMPKDTRAEIMGQLRKVYDGDFNKSFGTGMSIAWKGKMSMIAGVTTAIYTKGAMYSDMGERFIMYKMVLPERLTVTRRALSNIATVDMKERRTQIKTQCKYYLDQCLEIPTMMPAVDKQVIEDIIQLVNIATLARSAVERDNYSPNKEIDFKHDAEMPMRFAEQLIILASAFVVMNGNGELEEEDKKTLYKITLDSINMKKRSCLRLLLRSQTMTTKDMAISLDYPTSTISRSLQELNAFGLVERLPGSGSKGDSWELKEEYKKILLRFENVEEEVIVDKEVDKIEESTPFDIFDI